MPALDLDDGYTLDGATKPDHAGAAGLPVVAFRYRPALWEALTEWRRAVGTAREVEATAKLVADHVASWDVTQKGKPAPVSADAVRKLPEPILNQIFAAVATWAPRGQAAAEGNSPPG